MEGILLEVTSEATEVDEIHPHRDMFLGSVWRKV